MTERENWLEITLRLPTWELGALLRSLTGGGTGENPETARENSAFEPERFEQLRRREREKTGDPAEELTEAADRSSREGAEAPERAETAEKPAPSRRTGRAGRREENGPYTFQLEEAAAAPDGEGNGKTWTGRAVNRTGPAVAAEHLSAAGGTAARALSDAWERDSRRYDGGFNRY